MESKVAGCKFQKNILACQNGIVCAHYARSDETMLRKQVLEYHCAKYLNHTDHKKDITLRGLPKIKRNLSKQLRSS